MAYEVNYAGIPLHDYVNIRNVNRTVLPPRENFTKDIPSQNGQFYMGYKYAPREIILECTLKGTLKEDYMDVINELTYILDVNVPSKMIISDSPDKFVYAVLDGSTSLERFKHGGTVELKFVCYDPYIYATKDDFFIDKSMDDRIKTIRINNSGSTSTYPLIDVGFTKDAHFLQCTDSKKRTVLIGTPPDVDKPQGAFDPVVLNDTCEVLTNWNNVGNIIDDGVVDGDLVVNAGGYGLTCTNYGSSSDGWHGGARRRNLNTTLTDFKIEVKMEHNSKGDMNGTGNGSIPPITQGTSTVKYEVTADPSLRIRLGRGTNFDSIAVIPKGTIVNVADISSNWGKVTYNGKTGYIYMEYTKKYVEPVKNTTTSNMYITTGQLRVRSGRGTSYATIAYMPKDHKIAVSDISSNWGKVTYNGKTGYSSMKYLSPISNGKSTRADDMNSEETCEDRMGKIEVYGFDVNGNKLFKMSMKDTSEWYEHSYPEVQIGSNVVLTDNSSTPPPKNITVLDEQDENKTVVKNIDSGAFGSWNEFIGWFTIQRKNGIWYCKVEKTDNSGKIVKMIETQSLNNSSYPKGQLSNVVIWIGKYKNNIAVDSMSVNNIKVTNIGEPPKPKENKPIFKKGDSVIVDFSTQTTRLIRQGQTISMMQHLDIGSEFFSCPVGQSEILIRSDDTNIDANATIRKRWI